MVLFQMNYLRELMKDYKNEVKEILAADKTLAMEIQVCSVLVSNPLTHLKDRCVSIGVFEASKLIIAVRGYISGARGCLVF